MPVQLFARLHVALRAQGRWTYVYGNLDPAQHMDALLDGAQKYRDAPDGLVPWRERPEHFRKNCIARIPPMEATNVA
jgi:predicted metal-binding protein